MSKTTSFFLLFLVIALSFCFGYTMRGKKPVEEPEVKTDTVYVRDTVYSEHPEPTSVVPDGYALYKVSTVDALYNTISDLSDKVTDLENQEPSIVTKDSLVYIQVPMEVKEFSDSTYRCQVRGFNTEMLWHETYRQTVYIPTTKTIRVPAPRFGFGIAVGPAVLYNEKWHAGVGAAVGIYYKF